MGLRDIEATLPPGFRFYPSDEELVCHYLYKKIANEKLSRGTLVEVDLHTCEPWQLPDGAKLGTNEWYFFSFRDRKYATGLRTNRATTCGYWKATGKDRAVLDPATRSIVGMRKTLVFYRDRAPNGIKTGWIMHEFRLEGPHTPPKEDWVLCRVFHKNSREASSASFSLETPETRENLNCSWPPRKLQQQEASSPPHDLPEPALSHHHLPQQPILSDDYSSLPLLEQQQDHSNTLLNLAMWHCNFLGFPQVMVEEDAVGSAYGFVMGMESSESEELAADLHGSRPPNLV